MATLGAELGCGRHLGSTVVTGPSQWSSTLLAELRLIGVLVPALRAFHCRPQRKKRAKCTVRVTSRIIDDNDAFWPYPRGLGGAKDAQVRGGRVRRMPEGNDPNSALSCLAISRSSRLAIARVAAS